MLPDFLGIGPGRTGTTWLHQALEGHVDLPHGIKETGFFGVRFSKGIDWYAQHFRYASGERKIAEISTYFIRPHAPERVKQLLPKCRLICTLRNPVDHAYSVYKLMRCYVWTRVSFEEALARSPNLDETNRYAFHLKRWFDLFGRENVLVTNYDELRASPQAYLDRICDFVGIERISLAGRNLRDDVHSFARAPATAIWLRTPGTFSSGFATTAHIAPRTRWPGWGSGAIASDAASHFQRSARNSKRS
jgi:hypothetical protein